MKRVLVPAAVVVLSIVVAMALGEVAVRALYKDATVMYPRYHTDYRYGPYTLRGIRPHAEFWHTSADGSWRFVTNGRGFRSTREFSYDKPAGTLRVLALGDSHTQGYEVRQEATYAAVLERYLAHRGAKAEVLNAGVSGFSTAEALAFLENEGHKYRPDVVVLGFYANDYEDNLKAGLFALQDGELAARKHEHIPGVRIQNFIYGVPGVRWLSENSYAYSVLFNGVWLHFKSALRSRAAGAAPADLPEVDYAVPTQDGHSEYEVALAVALVRRMQRFCEAHGMRLIVVDIPRAGAPYRSASSIQPKLLEGVELVASGELLEGYDGAAEMHVPRGHRHISELTHARIGIELGRRILGR